MIKSRVGRKPVTVPAGVEVKVQGQDLHFKGSKGQAAMPIHPFVKIELDKNQIQVRSNTEGKYQRGGSGARLNKAITGTVRAKIQNLVSGITKGFEKKLVLVGVGYRAQVKGKILTLSIGFSHPVNFTAPEGITLEAPSQTEILVKGIDKHLVGHTAAMIRAVRGPEPYKGKGIRYSDEVIIRKETKKK